MTCPLSDQIIEVKGQADVPATGICNGVAIWMHWQLSQDVFVSDGPTAPIVIGENIQWDLYSKQGVYFFKSPVGVADNKKKLHYQVNLTPSKFELTFSFSME